MTLQDLANIGELVGGIGVLATLIFVVLQLRQNTRAIQSANAREAGDAMISQMQANMASPAAHRQLRSFRNAASSTRVVCAVHSSPVLLPWSTSYLPLLFRIRIRSSLRGT